MFRPVLLRCLIAITISFLALTSNAQVSDEDPFLVDAELKGPDAAVIAVQLNSWLDSQSVPNDIRSSISHLWSKDDGETPSELHARVLQSLRSVPGVADHLKIRDIAALQRWIGSTKSSFVRTQISVQLCQELVLEQLHDEALGLVASVKPEDAVDPARLLFYRAVARYQLSQFADARNDLMQLQNQLASSPLRYRSVAALILEKMESIQDNSLEHIAIQMGDIRRRLNLGRATDKVRTLEDNVLASLDKLIKELEDQQQQQQQQGSNSSDGPGSNSSQNAAEESRVLGGSGEGIVVPKVMGIGSSWGSLPPRQREQILQQLGRKFPSYYRSVIEEYFRVMARGR